MAAKVLLWILEHLSDIPGMIAVVRQIIADFGDDAIVTDELLDAEWAKLNPVPPEGEPPAPPAG